MPSELAWTPLLLFLYLKVFSRYCHYCFQKQRQHYECLVVILHILLVAKIARQHDSPNVVHLSNSIPHIHKWDASSSVGASPNSDSDSMGESKSKSGLESELGLYPCGLGLGLGLHLAGLGLKRCGLGLLSHGLGLGLGLGPGGPGRDIFFRTTYPYRNRIVASWWETSFVIDRRLYS